MTPAARPSDDGFGIMEVVVAAVILALAATTLATVFATTLGLVKSNTQRTVAANLATQQIEKLQAVRALDIPDGLTVIGPVTVSGTAYTIKQTAEYATSTGTACSGSGGAVTSKRITLQVTWPNMGNVKAVRSDTLRALGTGTDGLASTTGAVAVTVQDASGNASSGIIVSLQTTSGTVLATQTSGNDGCVVFAGLSAGNYVVSASTVGYVGQSGTQLASTSFGVTAGATTKATLPYDLLGGLLITPTPSNPAYTVPTSIGTTISTSLWSPLQSAAYVQCTGSNVAGCVSGTTTRLAASLFPGSYAAWAGTCADAVPTSPTLVAVTSGTTAAYTATNLGFVNATISTILTGKHLYAVHAADGTCAAGEVYDLGVVTNGQLVKVALPYGTWRLQLSSTGVTTQTAVLSSSSGIKSVTVLL